MLFFNESIYKDGCFHFFYLSSLICLPISICSFSILVKFSRKFFSLFSCRSSIFAKRNIGLLTPNVVFATIPFSEKMIAKAKELNVYDSLIVGDIVEILSSSKGKYDLLIALDVLIYIGEVKALFKTVRSCCNINAFFIFSVETKVGDGYSLLKTARYSHSENYILNSASEDFNLIESQEIKLRKENEGWILGKIYIFQAS